MQLQYSYNMKNDNLTEKGSVLITIRILIRIDNPVSKQDQKFIWSDQNFSR